MCVRVCVWCVYVCACLCVCVCVLLVVVVVVARGGGGGTHCAPAAPVAAGVEWVVGWVDRRFCFVLFRTGDASLLFRGRQNPRVVQPLSLGPFGAESGAARNPLRS